MISATAFGITNFCFFVFVGIPIFIIGTVIDKMARSTFDSMVSEIAEEFNEQVGTTIDTLNLDFAAVTDSFKIIFFALSITITVISFIGVLGSCCENRPILLVYCLIMIMLILLQLILLIMLITDIGSFDGCLKPRLRKSLENSYKGLNSSDMVTLTWNSVMKIFECCGVDSFVDFDTAKQWTRGLNGTTGFKTPLICCKELSMEYLCALYPNETNTNFVTGCYTAMKDKLTSKKGLLIVAAVALLIIQIAMLAFEIFVMRTLHTKDWVCQGFPCPRPPPSDLSQVPENPPENPPNPPETSPKV